MRWLRFLVGASGLTLASVAVALGIATPWSPSGWTLCAVTAFGAVAILLPRLRPMLGIAAGCMLAVLICLRFTGASPRAKMLTLPARSTRVLTRMVDEQDASLVGARLLQLAWRLPRNEREELASSMQHAYVEMRDELGSTPSPIVDTFLARQTPSAFDALTIEAHHASRTAVIFLHGYGGSFTLECWLIARAADAIGALTVCPATGFSGHWSSSEGEHTLRATIDYVHARGASHIYLAGLSNGGVGAGTLASDFAPSLKGLILISGTPAQDRSGLPALVVQGDHDTVASAISARAYATRSHVTYAGFDAGHFVLMTRRDDVRATIATWLTRQESSR